MAKSYLFTHALPWLAYPPVDSDGPMEDIPLVLQNPSEPLLYFQWNELLDKLQRRTFWLWMPQPKDPKVDQLIRFMAPFFDLPDDPSRNDSFAAFVASAARQGKSEVLSFYDVIEKAAASGQLPDASPQAIAAAQDYLKDAARYLNCKYTEGRE